jgi:hypothetical protein
MEGNQLSWKTMITYQSNNLMPRSIVFIYDSMLDIIIATVSGAALIMMFLFSENIMLNGMEKHDDNEAPSSSSGFRVIYASGNGKA